MDVRRVTGCSYSDIVLHERKLSHLSVRRSTSVSVLKRAGATAKEAHFASCPRELPGGNETVHACDPLPASYPTIHFVLSIIVSTLYCVCSSDSADPLFFHLDKQFSTLSHRGQRRSLAVMRGLLPSLHLSAVLALGHQAAVGICRQGMLQGAFRAGFGFI